jgi:hypothetical protein
VEFCVDGRTDGLFCHNQGMTGEAECSLFLKHRVLSHCMYIAVCLKDAVNTNFPQPCKSVQSLLA